MFALQIRLEKDTMGGVPQNDARYTLTATKKKQFRDKKPNVMRPTRTVVGVRLLNYDGSLRTVLDINVVPPERLT